MRHDRAALDYVEAFYQGKPELLERSLDPELAKFDLSYKEELEAFLVKYPKAECVQYGAVMRGYVEVPPALLKDARKLNALWKTCCENARTLKAEPTTRKKSAKKKASKKKATRRRT